MLCLTVQNFKLSSIAQMYYNIFIYKLPISLVKKYTPLYHIYVFIFIYIYISGLNITYATM